MNDLLKASQEKLVVILQQMDEMNIWVNQLKGLLSSIKDATSKIYEYNKDIRIFRLDQNLKTIQLQDSLIENDLKYFISCRKYVFDYLFDELISTHRNMYQLYLGIHRGDDNLTTQRNQVSATNPGQTHAIDTRRRGSILPLPNQTVKQPANPEKRGPRTAEQHMRDCRNVFQDIIELNQYIYTKIQQYHTILNELKMTKTKGYGVSKLIIDLKSQIGKFMLERDILVGNLDRILSETYEMNQQMLCRMLTITAYWKPNSVSLTDQAVEQSQKKRDKADQEHEILVESKEKLEISSLNAVGNIKLEQPLNARKEAQEKVMLYSIKKPTLNQTKNGSPISDTSEVKYNKKESIQYIEKLTNELEDHENSDKVYEVNMVENEDFQDTSIMNPLKPFQEDDSMTEKMRQQKNEFVDKKKKLKKDKKMGNKFSKVFSWLFGKRTSPESSPVQTETTRVLEEAITHNKDQVDIEPELHESSSSSSSSPVLPVETIQPVLDKLNNAIQEELHVPSINQNLVMSLPEESVPEESVPEESVPEESVPEESVAEESVAEEPAVEEPAVEEPAVEEPVAEEPAVEEPVAEEPVAEEPVVEEVISITEVSVEEEVMVEKKDEDAPEEAQPTEANQKVEEPKGLTPKDTTPKRRGGPLARRR